MNIHKVARIIIPVFFLHLLACQPEEDIIQDKNMLEVEVEDYLIDAEEMEFSFNERIADDIITCSVISMEMPLISWPGTETGTFSVNNNMDYLIASFELNPDGPWGLKQTQLLVEVQETMETPRKTIIKTKKFLFPVHHVKGTHSFTYMIPLSDLKLTKDNVQCISVAGIARLDNSNFTLTKFAIAQNNMSKRISRRTWLHEYCLSECSMKRTIDHGIAWMDGIAYQYDDNKTGFYEIFASEMENNYVDLFIIDEISGTRETIGKLEILFWGASLEYDLFIEFQPNEGYDILDAQIYVGILDPIRGPETFKNPVTFDNQNSLVFKKKVDYTPVYVAIAATVCSEKNNL